MENKIVIDLKKNLIKDSEIQFLNNNEECIICSELTENDLVLINNFCKCYNAVKICEKCFIKWIKENNECIICRNKFSFNKYHIKNNKFKNKIQNVCLDINDESNDIVQFRNRNIFISYRTFKMWIHFNRYKLLKNTIIFAFIAFIFISIFEFLHYQRIENNYNNTIIY